MEVISKQIYSKKKQREIMKMHVRMRCNKLKNKWKKGRLTGYRDEWSEKTDLIVKYESSVFAQAKWKKITD